MKQESTEPQVYELDCYDGEKRTFSANQLLDLARAGVQGVQDKQKTPEPVEEKKDEEITVESLQKRVDDTNAEFKNYKAEIENERNLHKFKADLSTEMDKFDLVKDHPSIRNSIQVEVASRLYQDQRLKLVDVVKQVVDDRMKVFGEMTKNSKYADGKVKAKLDQITQGGGGMPAIESDKPREAKDVTSGRSRREVTDFLRQAMET